MSVPPLPGGSRSVGEVEQAGLVGAGQAAARVVEVAGVTGLRAAGTAAPSRVGHRMAVGVAAGHRPPPGVQVWMTPAASQSAQARMVGRYRPGPTHLSQRGHWIWSTM